MDCLMDTGFPLEKECRWFGGDENVLELDTGDVAQHCECTKYY